MPRRDVLSYLAIVAVCLTCALHIRPLVVDDSFIAHRYAANLVQGRGLVFTAGQRVEAVSDVGWTLLMTIPQFFHWRPEIFALFLGFFSVTLALLIAYRTAVAQLAVFWPVALAVVAGSACNAEFWLVALNGIESGMYALFLILGLSLVLQNKLTAAGVVLGIAGTLRPESIALVPLTLAVVALLGFVERRTMQAAWLATHPYLALVLPWALISAAVLVWRLSYYGEGLPNTVFAKSHPTHLIDLARAAKYALLFSLAALPWTFFALVGIVASLWRRRSLAVCLISTWLTFQAAILVLSGGDWMPGHRFLTVFIPILALSAALGCEIVFRRFRQYRWAMTVAMLLVLAAVQSRSLFWTAQRGLLERHALLDLVGTYYEPPFIELAHVLKPVLLPTDVLSPEVLGVFSYLLLDTPMHDWLGLADRHIAHHGVVYYPPYGKADPAYSVDLVAPTLFAFTSGPGNLEVFQEKTKGRFSRQYICWQIVDQPLILAVRRDRADALLAALRGSTLRTAPISPPPYSPPPGPF